MVVGSDSSTATSVMRPDIVAGPMNRSRSVESMAASGCVCAAAAARGTQTTSSSAVRRRIVLVENAGEGQNGWGLVWRAIAPSETSTSDVATPVSRNDLYALHLFRSPTSGLALLERRAVDRGAHGRTFLALALDVEPRTGAVACDANGAAPHPLRAGDGLNRGGSLSIEE